MNWFAEDSPHFRMSGDAEFPPCSASPLSSELAALAWGLTAALSIGVGFIVVASVWFVLSIFESAREAHDFDGLG